MYLGTSDPALQVAKNLRDEEIQLASNYHRSRVATRNARIKSRSTTSRMFRITQPVRRSD